MHLNYRFPPDAERARAIDKNVRGALADSLAHIAEATDGMLDTQSLQRLIAQMREGARFAPSAFALYYELVFALVEQQLQNAAEILDKLSCEQPVPAATPCLYTLDDPHIAQHAQRYRLLMESDPIASFTFRAPPAAAAHDFRSLFDRSWKTIRKALPELAGEIEAIVTHVIMVASGGSGARFDGGSSFRSWGALFLNIESHTSRIGLIEAIAHESAHCLLFGFCTEEPLVTNPDDAVFPSPLRTDMRPMDGIFHATYVSARMYWAMSRLLACGALDVEEAAAADQSLRDNRLHFEQGCATIAQFGMLTATGRELMEDARRYMRQGAQLDRYD